MSYTEVRATEFGGLNTRDEPQQIGLGGAGALNNVDFSVGGQLRTRDGSSQFATGAASTPYTLVPYNSAKLLVACSDGLTTWTLYSVATNGTKTSLGTITSIPLLNTYAYIAQIGIPATGASNEVTRAYVAVEGANLRRYDGTTLTSLGPAGTGAFKGAPSFCTVMPTENRLVQANYNDAATSPTGNDGSPSTVFFSDADAPETYGANNFVNLQAGDGEEIRGMATWRESVFVFKATTMFVFGSSSIDADGNPVFNYRTVDLPDTFNGAICAGDDGVYFGTDYGIYRTTGDVPQRVSDDLRTTFVPNGVRIVNLAWANGRLYTSILDGAAHELLVMDPRTGQWTIWTFAHAYALAGVCEWRSLTFLGDSNGRIVYFDNLQTTDFVGGTPLAITGSFTSGWDDAGIPNAKVVREMVVSGSGTVSTNLVADGVVGSTATLDLTNDLGYHRVATRARYVGVKIAGTAPWTVADITLRYRDSRGGTA